MPRPSSPFMAATHVATPQAQIDEIKAVALILRLMIDDRDHRDLMFASLRRKPRASLAQVTSTGGEGPADTDLCRDISRLCPSAQTVHVYFHSTSSSLEPDRAITLKRIPSTDPSKSDRWWPTSSYISRGFKHTHTDGVLCRWHANLHYVETATGPMTVSRCGGGSVSGITRMADDLSIDFELRRQLTFAILRKPAISNNRRTKLYVAKHAGKLTIDHEAPGFSALLQPLTFTMHSYRAQACSIGKAPYYIHGQIDGDDIMGYSGKVPWLVGIETGHDEFVQAGDTEALILLKELLYSNLIPFVAIVREGAAYDLIQPEYSDSSSTHLAVVKTYRRLPPTFVCERSPKGWLPNGPLAEALYAYMTHDPLPGEYLAEHRRQLATRLLVTTLTPRRKGEPLPIDEVLAFHGLGPEQMR